MKKIISLTLALPLLLITPTGLLGCANTRMAGERGDDARIKARVGRRLSADPDVRRVQIDVDVINRVVTLRGEVDDQRTAEEAVAIAQHTKGVERVVNQLQIEGYAPEGTNGDAGIRAAVGYKLLADPDVRRRNIDVDVVNGVVYLSGIVHDQEARDAAGRIASNIDGVVRVQNELQVSHDDERGTTDTPTGEAAPVHEPHGTGQR